MLFFWFLYFCTDLLLLGLSFFPVIVTTRIFYIVTGDPYKQIVICHYYWEGGRPKILLKSKSTKFVSLGRIGNPRTWIILNQLMVPLSNNLFHKGILGIQTTNPNHQFTLSWLTSHFVWFNWTSTKKNCTYLGLGSLWTYNLTMFTGRGASQFVWYDIFTYIYMYIFIHTYFSTFVWINMYIYNMHIHWQLSLFYHSQLITFPDFLLVMLCPGKVRVHQL